MARKTKSDKSNFDKLKKEIAHKKKKAEIFQMSHENIESDFVDEKEVTIMSIEETESNHKGIEKVVVFQLGEEEYALPILYVKEIVRIPKLIQPPSLQKGIIGLCNMRSELLPIVDVRPFFHIENSGDSKRNRIIVTDYNGQKIGIVTNKVSEVIEISKENRKESPTNLKKVGEGFIKDIIIYNKGKRIIIMLNGEKLMEYGTKVLKKVEQESNLLEHVPYQKKVQPIKQIVIFTIDNREYGLDIHWIKEIINLPQYTKTSNVSECIKGVISHREQIIPILDLGSLLGSSKDIIENSNRVIIITVEHISFGIVVERVSQIVSKEIKVREVSEAIKFNSGFEFFKEMIELDNGNRLVMILDPNKLVNMIKKIKKIDDFVSDSKYNIVHKEKVENDIEQIIIFQLEKEEYAVDISNVIGLSRIADITFVPGVPYFIEGMIDIRGESSLVVNLRKLFQFKEQVYKSNTKAIIVEKDKKKLAIITDSPIKILRIPKKCIENTTQIYKFDHNNYIWKIAKLDDNTRNIMILNITEIFNLLSFGK